MARLLTTLALLCLATYALGAVTFYLNEGTKKCFIEDLPKDTLVVAAYRAADIDSAKWAPDGVSRRGLTEVIGIKVHCTGPTQEVVAQRVTGEVGKVAFTSKHAGEHEICFQSNSTRWFGSGSLKVELDLQTGAEATDYEDLAQAEHLSQLEMLVRRLNDRVADIRREQAYFKAREMEFRDESEEVNSKVMWYSFAQTVVLLASGIFQIRHLQGFFRSKKMV